MSDDTAGTELSSAPASEAATGTAGKIKTHLGAAADIAKDKIDYAREPIADKLLGAADTLRAQGERLPRRAAGVAQGAADKLEASATYLVSNSVEQIMEDVRSVIRSKPAQSLLIAGALGFLIGRTLSKD